MLVRICIVLLMCVVSSIPGRQAGAQTPALVRVGLGLAQESVGIGVPLAYERVRHARAQGNRHAVAGSSLQARNPMEAATRPPPESMNAAADAIMDRDFIARNQIIERYLSGRLPLKGAADFERFCREHPEALDELGLPERVNKALRLLDASGMPEPWEQPGKEFWRKPQVPLGLAAATFVLLVALAIVGAQSSAKSDRIAALEQRATDQPLEPATSTRTIRLLPSRKRATSSPAVVIGAGSTQLADLKIDMAHSSSSAFRITVDRVDQGRVAVLHNMLKDSNGHVRFALNSSALGPGNYRLTIDGLDWRGRATPEAWITIAIAR